MQNIENISIVLTYTGALMGPWSILPNLGPWHSEVLGYMSGTSYQPKKEAIYPLSDNHMSLGSPITPYST